MKGIFRRAILLGVLFSGSVLAANLPDIGNSNSLDAQGFSTTVNYPKYSDLPAYLVEMNNGKLTPETLVVPAHKKFRIIVRNLGTKPAEFESNQLRQEKALFMNTESAVLVLPLDPGSYDYFDDFTPGAKGKIIAK